MIEVEGLDVVFGHGADRVQAVRDVSFRVPEGATFGLVGESGSGKSTVLRALSGLNPHWSGRVAIAGKPQSARRDKAFYKLVQKVFQDRKSVVSGKSVSVRVDLGGRRIIKTKKKKKT